MTVRSIMWLSIAMLAANLMFSSAGQTAEKAEKVRKEQLVGEWKHIPGDRPAFTLREDGSGFMVGGIRDVGRWQARWDFNEHYQMLVYSTKQFRRQYKAKIEKGKIILYDGREVFRHGVSLNSKLKSPLDQAYKAEATENAEAPK